MADPTGRLSLIHPLTTYCDYFSRDEIDTFCRCYAAFILPYHIKTASFTSTVIPQEVYRHIYSAVQEGVPTVFIQWHRGTVGKGAHIALLCYVSSYAPQMGMPPLPWDYLSFA